MDKKHIVVLSVSAGAGHVRAAQALCATAEREFPQLRVTHIDVMDVVPSGFRKVYADSYLKLIEKLPLLWAYLYQRTDRPPARSKFAALRRSIEKLNTRKLDDELKKLAPDAVVCTHFLPAELLSRRIARGHASPPVWVQVTDFDVHSLWVHPHMRGYCVANDEIAWRLAERGIAREHVHVTGIPIMPQFSVALDRGVCAAELGLDPARTTLLMMAGGAGVGGIDLLAQRVAALPDDLQIIVLAGRNEELLTRLRELAEKLPRRLFPLGFTKTIERAMVASDIAITKPGGLSTSECLAMGLPMILVSPIPGQEERNADFMLESGVAIKAQDAAALEYKLTQLLRSPQRLATMRERMTLIAKPHAAADVLKIIDADLGAQ